MLSWNIDAFHQCNVMTIAHCYVFWNVFPTVLILSAAIDLPKIGFTHGFVHGIFEMIDLVPLRKLYQAPNWTTTLCSTIRRWRCVNYN